MNSYDRYRKSDLDLSALGLGRGPSRSDYIATPIGATVFAWAGVDGIHYGRVRGYGEMIFAFSPSNAPGESVHPLAESFDDFLRLVLAAGSADALEQAYAWDEAQFNTYLAEYPPTPEQAAALAAIRDTFGLEPMPRPFAYLKVIQSGFDDSQLKFCREYRACLALNMPKSEPAPEPWKVTFHEGRGRAGKEIAVNRSFDWAGSRWHIPAVYACAEGLVIDFCVENGLDDAIDFKIEAVVNDSPMRMAHGTGAVWPDVYGEPYIDHYALDREKRWHFHRFAFPWATERKPVVKSLSITLSAYPAALPGIRFTAAAGDTLTLTHPRTGAVHTLTVESVTPETIDASYAHNSEYELPAHLVELTYTLSPDLPRTAFAIRDTAPHDEPRRIAPPAPGSIGDSAVSLIVSAKDDGEHHKAVSSLHFDPPEAVEWLAVFREKPADNLEFILI